MKPLQSISIVVRQFDTGDRPVLVCCSDMNDYICKYNRFGASAYALAREFIGTRFAVQWGLIDDNQVLVHILSEHWPEEMGILDASVPCLGRRWISGVIDVTDVSQNVIEKSENAYRDLLKIVLLDIWLSNDDRTANNMNLLYDLERNTFIPIDFAGIFNTSFSKDFDLLSIYDSLCYSNLFLEYRELFRNRVDWMEMKEFFDKSRRKCLSDVKMIMSELPEEWKIDKKQLSDIFNTLFSDNWNERVWDNFINLVDSIKR